MWSNNSVAVVVVGLRLLLVRPLSASTFKLQWEEGEGADSRTEAEK